MSKIGTITLHETENYGAILQTYALQRYLKKSGYDSEVINYLNSKRGIKVLSLKKKLEHFIWHKIVRRLLVGKSRERKANKFFAKNIPISSIAYMNSEILHNNPPLYDIYITGSDQVWNSNITNGDSSYFLTFAPKDKKRISYSASFGVTVLSDKCKENYVEWLSCIDFLSVRETQGKKLIKDIVNKEAMITVDPTLLLDRSEWEKIAVPYKNKRSYVLCYHMPGDKIVNRAISKIAKKIADKNNWDVVSIGQKEYMKLIPGNKKIFNAGPDEYVGLFQKASFIITNSFHGTVFSIIFNKPFYVPINNSIPTEKVLSSRILSLLNILNIEDRLVLANEEFDIIDIGIINYAEVNKRLIKARVESEKFIKNALE